MTQQVTVHSVGNVLTEMRSRQGKEKTEHLMKNRKTARPEIMSVVSAAAGKRS